MKQVLINLIAECSALVQMAVGIYLFAVGLGLILYLPLSHLIGMGPLEIYMVAVVAITAVGATRVIWEEFG